jgi:hypothetical protein
MEEIMKLIDILYERRHGLRGTYYGARATDETIDKLQEFMHKHKIPNATPGKDIHCTVVYSRIFVGEPALHDLDPHWKGQFNGWNVWPTRPAEEEESSNALTLGFDCPEMEQRHKDLRSHGATHDFPDFKPHFSMSYDIGDYPHTELPKYDGPLHLHHEYTEPLNLNWVKTKLKKE